MKDIIVKGSKEMMEELVAIRRDIHAHPEKGWEEVRTSSLVAKFLDNLGYRVLIGENVCKEDSRMGLPDKKILDDSYARAIRDGADEKYAKFMKDGKTGVIGVLEFKEKGPTCAFRFDMDALPIIEDVGSNHYPSKNGFSSKYEGNMHACGHDGHTAIGLGLAKEIMMMKDKLKGKVIIIFQPAEERVRGAKSIVENGHLKGVDYFLSSHITKQDKNNNVDIFPGSGEALATSKLDVKIYGKSSHAAGYPEEGNNTALAMATCILNLYSIPRHSKGMTRINVGLANAGSGRNVIADYAYMQIETRGETSEINEYVRSYAENIIKNACQMHNCDYQISLEGEAGSFESDIELMELISDVAYELGLKYKGMRLSLSGSEDISYMMEEVQKQGGKADFIRLVTEVDSIAHNPSYDFNEEVIEKGVNVFSLALYKLLKK